MMNVYLAEINTRPWLLGESNENLFSRNKERAMKTYLAGEYTVKNGKLANWEGLYILESFFYLRNNPEFVRLVKSVGSLLLDSGAFTFMNNSKEKVDWDRYINEYAAFINKYDIKLFLELDIDSIVGLTEVERLRNRLEELTGKKPIPVWHKSRGKDYFITMCEKYPYVALGGIVTKEIPTNKYELAFPWFIKTAHEYGCKIHGLGYTRIKNLRKYRFDSVDSTAWLHGSIGGFVYKFKPTLGELEKVLKPQGKRLSSRAAATHNFNEWVKFQKWADKFL